MAKAAAKKEQKARKAASSTYLPLIGGANALYILRLVLRRATKWHYVALAITTLLYCVTYGPTIDAAGGPPGGLSDYFYDVLILTLLAQALAAFTDYAWLIGCLVPLFALFKLIERFWQRPDANKKPAKPPKHQKKR